MTSPPQAALPAIGLGLPLALSAMMWMVLAHYLSSCPVQLGLIPAASQAFARHGWVFNPLDESNRHRQSGPTFALSGSSANGSTLLVMPPSFARSFCILGIPPRLSSQLVTLVFCGHSRCGCWFELASWPAFCGSRAYQEDSVHLRHLCRGDAVYVRTCQVRAWCSCDQL